MAQNFKDTLNLPQTDFPMRANLAKREPDHFKAWDENNLYQDILERRKSSGKGDFVLHDGPPYANGNIHCGHALNKILKDILIRYKSMRGYRSPYVPGWDCHGLPIEQQVLKQVGDKIHDMEAVEVRRLCQDYARQFIDIQREQFKRLGILGDWDKPYATLDPQFEAGILSCFRDIVARGLVYKGYKSVHWDPVFRTALAEAEIEYHNHTSNSIYVSFPLIDAEKYPSLSGLDLAGATVSLVIWTTTPWTLPANMGVCLHPEFDYVALRHGDKVSIVAEGLAESFQKACKIEDATVLAKFKAAEFEKGWCRHPIFDDRQSLVMLGDHVTLEQGTGCVHTAPGHGADDFIIGAKYGLEVVVPVDDQGRFNDLYAEMQGTFVFDANPAIVEKLKDKGILLQHGKVDHEYPYSWRSKKPIIFRATEQWFMRLAEGGVRDRALKAIDDEVRWIPQWGYDRIRGMVERRPEWCLSRQRSWGVPIPALRSKKTGESILDPRIIDHFIAIVREKGTDAWFTEPVSALLPEGFVYEPTGESAPEDFEKENDILDVWFDSGSSHIACVEQDDRLRAPADMYLEGSDQHRGWFQSSLLTAVATRDRPPYGTVLTHGFVLDGEGKAMSKSMGNVISPLDLIDKYGADILRLWVASEDYRNDVGISMDIMDNISRTYRDMRNTFRFILGNLYDFDPASDRVADADLLPLDQWALVQLRQLIEAVTNAYESFEFHKVYQLCNKFVTSTLSATYHDMIKDRLYTMGKTSVERRSAQTALYQLALALPRLLAPILVFTADECRQFSPEPQGDAGKSIHLADWPEAPDTSALEKNAAEVDQILNLSSMVNEKLEELRRRKEIGQSLDACVTLAASADSPLADLLKRHEAALPEILRVSQVALESASAPADAPDSAGPALQVSAVRASGVRCPRCWRWVDELQESPVGETCARCGDAAF